MGLKQHAVCAGHLAVAAMRHFLAVAIVALYVMVAGSVAFSGVLWLAEIYNLLSQNQMRAALLTLVSLPLVAVGAILALPLTLTFGVQMVGVEVLVFAVLYVALFRTVATQRPYVGLLGAACALLGLFIDMKAALHGRLRVGLVEREPGWAYAGFVFAAAITAMSVSKTIVGVILNSSDEHDLIDRKRRAIEA